MTHHADTVALILAAGESRRMGTPKPLLPLGNETTLERLANLFAAVGIEGILVVTGHSAETIRNRLSNLPVKWIHNEEFQQGMLSSVKKGLAAIGAEYAWFFLLPVDIPLVRPRTLTTMLKERPAPNGDVSILHPTFMGRRGHPPLMSTRLIPGILAWDGPGGLGEFLALHHTEAAEVPVIDEFIRRDMDTPADYQLLSAAFSRYHIPTPAECTAILTEPSLFSENTAAHCRQVARLAAYLGKTLAACNVPLDVECITAGALLHDIAKGRKDHAAAGALMLREMGYSGIADIVSAHVDIEIPEASPLTESEVVHLADKLVRGDALVPFSVRFEYKLAKYGHDPSVRTAILKRMTDAETIVKRMEQAVGKSFQAIMDGFPQDPK